MWKLELCGHTSKLSGNQDKYEALRKLAQNLYSEEVNSLRRLIFEKVIKLKHIYSIEVTERKKIKWKERVSFHNQLCCQMTKKLLF